jgi:hypothetical protein
MYVSLGAVLANLPKEPSHSVVEYRVLERPHFPDEPKDGFVRLSVSEGMKSAQFREDIDDYLERWGDGLGCRTQ